MSIHSKTQPSFVDKVPADIWTEIVQNTQQSPATDSVYVARKFSRQNVVSASQVCNRLRRIIIETRSLWTSILVDFDSSTPNHDLLLTKLWLQRAGLSPLTITLLNIPKLDEKDPVRRECLAEILSQISRWKNVFLSWKSWQSEFWSTMDSMMCPAPLLEILVLDAKPAEDTIASGILPSKLWVDSPRLRKLAITLYVTLEDEDDYYPPEDGFTCWATSYHIPYQQLTHLRLDAYAHEIVSREELVSIFRSAPNLIASFIEGIAISDPSFESMDPILLQSLQHLYLEPSDDGQTINDASVSEILDYITAPSLVTLSIVGEQYWNIEAYENFIVRSSCHLEELNLVGTPISISDSLTCMEQAPSLRAVHLHNFEINESFLEAWTTWDATNGKFSICPNLERLSIAGLAFRQLKNRPANSSLPMITQALGSRLRPPHEGSRVFSTLLIPETNLHDVHPEIHALCDEPSCLKIEPNRDIGRKGGLWDLYSGRW